MPWFSRLLVLAAATPLLLLTACGGSDDSTGSPVPTAIGTETTTSADTSRPDTSNPDTSSPSPAATYAGDVAAIDVCAMLSQDDAAAVARDRGLNGAQTAATVYQLTATKQEYGSSIPIAGCKFFVDGDGAEGTVVIEVKSADGFSIFASGEKVAGLGDEAYKEFGVTSVRVRGLQFGAGENSFTDGFVVDLYRKMIPHLP